MATLLLFLLGALLVGTFATAVTYLFEPISPTEDLLVGLVTLLFAAGLILMVAL